MTITIDLTPERYEQLAEMARRLGVSPEEAARRGRDELLDRDRRFGPPPSTC